MRRGLIGVAVALALIALVACGSQGGASSRDRGTTPPAGASAGLTQKDGGEGGVTVTATWATQEHLKADGKLAKAAGRYDPASYVIFHLALDTHSGDLGRYNLAQLASLQASGAGPQASEAWVSLSNDSHHREGLLIFPKLAGAREVELSLKDLAGIPLRQFRWSVPE